MWTKSWDEPIPNNALRTALDCIDVSLSWHNVEAFKDGAVMLMQTIVPTLDQEQRCRLNLPMIGHGDYNAHDTIVHILTHVVTGAQRRAINLAFNMKVEQRKARVAGQSTLLGAYERMGYNFHNKR